MEISSASEASAVEISSATEASARCGLVGEGWLEDAG